MPPHTRFPEAPMCVHSRIRRSSSPVLLAVTVGVLTAATSNSRPATAQTSDPAPKVTGTFPAELMVDSRDGVTPIELHGEGIQDRELIWTPRLYRYYVRRVGEPNWRRILIPLQADYYETHEDVAPLRANGVAVRWGPGFEVIELPTDRYLRAPGALEFRIERGHWEERTVTKEGVTVYLAEFVVEGRSNVHRVPVRAAPVDPPVVTRVEPGHVPVAGAGSDREEVLVYADNLTPATTATVGSEPCGVRRLDPAGGTFWCVIPGGPRSRAGTYLVGVSTENGGARRLARLVVDAPLGLSEARPASLPVAATDASVVVAHEGSSPYRARVRTEEGAWQVTEHVPVGSDATRVTIPAPLLARSGTIEIELLNGAGVETVRVPVCGGPGDQPDECPLVASAPRGPTGGVQTERPRVVLPLRPLRIRQRPAPVVAPGGAVMLRPQPEPPGLVSVESSGAEVSRLADGGALAWRTVDGSRRLARLGPDGATRQVYPEGAVPVRDAAGNLFVRVAGGVLPLGIEAVSAPR